MHVLVLNGPVEFVREMSTRKDCSVSLLDAPSTIECLRELPLANWEAYTAKAKIDPRSILQVRNAIKRWKPDVVHAYGSRGLSHAVLSTTAMRNAPPVVSYRGITALLQNDLTNYISYGHPRVRGHACESEAVRQAMIQSGANDQDCMTVYNCMPPASATADRSKLQEWDIPADAFVIGTIAAIRPVKGIDILLEAVQQCLQRPGMDNAYWLIIGPVLDEHVQSMSKLPGLRDRVRLVGYQHNAGDLIHLADLFVMPSRAEGLCRSLLQAMAQGVCPVVSNAGGMKEVVRHGQEGLVVEKENPTALAEAMIHLKANPQERAGYAASAARRITDFCSAEKMVDRTIELYKQVLRQQPLKQAA